MNFINDPGDKYDKVKWDFPENLPVFVIGKYPYMATNYQNAVKLSLIREHIDKLCERLSKLKNNDNKDNIDLFLSIHKEMYYDAKDLPEPFNKISLNGEKTSRYLLSEIPKGTLFHGLNKPKLRYNQIDAPSIGKDGSGRALYRHIFLNLNVNDLDSLIIHELAHTMANHIFFREDDHHADFKKAENLIQKYW